MRESGLCACVTVDGPRGPRHIAKEGALFLAARANAPIVPIRLFMNRRKCFASWDKFQLPYPFSKVTMVCGDAYMFQGDIHNHADLDAACRDLQHRLENLTGHK